MSNEKKKTMGDGSEDGVCLKKEIGLPTAVAIIVGVIVGSGIFISPKGVLLEAGSVGLSLTIWSMCGLISLIGAICYSELGTCILKSGADYAYINESLGHFPAFLYLWVALVVIMPTGNAITALTFAEYVLQPIFPDCIIPEIPKRLLAALCINSKLRDSIKDIGTMSNEKKKTMGDGSEDGVCLKKEIGLPTAVAIIVGVIVGSGIFISPKGVLLEAGSVGLSLTIWSMCGLISLIGAICYSELGTCILKSGADYAYINESLGHFPAFLYLWVALVVIMPTGNAITALTFAEYVLQPIFPDCIIPEIPKRLLAALCITILTAINCMNVKWATRVQDVFTVAKVFALIMIIITGFIIFFMGEQVDSFEDPWDGTNTNVGGVAMAFYSGLFSYAGWNYLNFVTEELKDPYRNLPRAIWISIPLVTIIYVMANIAYFAVLTPFEMIESNAVAVVFANRVYGKAAFIMPLFVACSTFGSVNGAIFTSSRLFFVGARQGHLPDFLATISIKNLTPMPSLIFGCVMSLLMLSSSNIFELINYGSFVESSFIGLSITGMLYLRYKRPDMHRPIRVWIGFPIIFLVICVFLILLPLTNGPMECLMGILVVSTGIPVYIIGVKWKTKPEIFHTLLEKFTLLTQKICLSVQEEHKEE